jgi:hypothetical protein
MYRTPAVVEPNPVDPPKSVSLAEQFNQLSKIARDRIEEEKQKAFLDPSISKKAKKLYVKILRDAKKEADKGRNSIFWSNSDMFIFGKWTVSLPIAMAISDFLKKDHFYCDLVETIGDPGQYYISVKW